MDQWLPAGERFPDIGVSLDFVADLIKNIDIVFDQGFFMVHRLIEIAIPASAHLGGEGALGFAAA